jgi:hypothetical protein
MRSPSDHPLCQSPPKTEEEADQCDQSWYNMTTHIDFGGVLYNFSGGGGGGGASMLRARYTESGDLFTEPLVVAGGGGGTSAIP